MSEEGDAERENEPFGDLLEEIDRRRREDGEDQFDEAGDVEDQAVQDIFTEESFDELETDELWEEIAERDPTTPSEGDRRGSDPASVEGSETDVVPKRSFCEACPHLTEPPEFRCTHDGTEIVSFADRDHVRVRNCPIVEERRLQDE